MVQTFLYKRFFFYVLGLGCGLWMLTGSGYALEPIPVMLRLMEEVNVPARGEGQISKMLVREGDVVQENSNLAQIDDLELQLRLHQVTLEWKNAQRKAKNQVKLKLATKALEVTERELGRAEIADDRFDRSVSQTELDRLRLSQEKAFLEVEQAKIDLEESKFLEQFAQTEMQVVEYQHQRMQIIAPIRAVVAEVYVRQGEWVRPGDQVVRLVRTDRLRAEGFVQSSQLSDNLQGQQATLTVTLPGGIEERLSVEIVFVSPEINPVNGQVRVWAEVSNQKGKLHPGLAATMAISPVDR